MSGGRLSLDRMLAVLSLPGSPQRLDLARELDAQASRFEHDADDARNRGLDSLAAGFDTRARNCRGQVLKALGFTVAERGRAGPARKARYAGPANSGVLVLATKRALRCAKELGYQGVIESAVERAIETSEPVLRISRTDSAYRLTDRLHVRVRELGRTPQGRRKVELRGVIDVLAPPGVGL